MLHCTMNSSAHSLKLGLEDLLADLWHARRQNDLGRLALLTYCDMRRWARVAHEEGLAERAWSIVRSCPYADRDSFLSQIDGLIAEAEQLLANLAAPALASH
jgi:hypothetical protein